MKGFGERGDVTKYLLVSLVFLDFVAFVVAGSTPPPVAVMPSPIRKRTHSLVLSFVRGCRCKLDSAPVGCIECRHTYELQLLLFYFLLAFFSLNSLLSLSSRVGCNTSMTQHIVIFLFICFRLRRCELNSVPRLLDEMPSPIRKLVVFLFRAFTAVVVVGSTQRRSAAMPPPPILYKPNPPCSPVFSLSMFSC